jgi:hypothetical protein
VTTNLKGTGVNERVTIPGKVVSDEHDRAFCRYGIWMGKFFCRNVSSTAVVHGVMIRLPGYVYEGRLTVSSFWGGTYIHP